MSEPTQPATEQQSTSSNRSMSTPATAARLGLVIGIVAAAGAAAAWLLNQRAEGRLEQRTRDRLRSRAPHRVVPSAADIRVG